MQFSLDILATDFVPDKMTATSLYMTIVQQEDEMKRIDETIRGLNIRITKLRARKVSIQRSRNVYRALVASERKLPPEMLSEVFSHFITGSVSLHEDQLLLMQVCRRWRRIAAHTPFLWTNISLEIGSRLKLYQEIPQEIGFRLNPCQVITMGLANSGALPMTVSVHPITWCESDQWNMQEAIRLLAENFHRFRHFECDEGEELYRGILVHETKINAPLLESFVIHCQHGVGTPGPLPATGSTGCIRAPRLKAISLPHVSLMDHISFEPISLRDVTLVIGGTQEILPLVQFLASCPNISVLKLILHEAIDPPGIEGRPRLLLPCLDELFIEFQNWDYSCEFLRTIEAPALQKLCYTYNDYEDQPLALATLDSLCDHNSPLQDLRICWAYLNNGPPLAPMFDRLQNLRSLILSPCMIDDSILQSLTPDIGSPSSEWKCPLLSVLDVSYSDYSHKLFLRLVKSRVPTTPDGAVNGRRYLQHVDASFLDSDMDAEGRDAFSAALEDIGTSCDGYLQVNSTQD